MKRLCNEKTALFLAVLCACLLSSAIAGAAIISFTDPSLLVDPIIIDNFGVSTNYLAGSSISLTGMTVTGLNTAIWATTYTTSGGETYSDLEPQSRTVDISTGTLDEVRNELLLSFTSPTSAFGWDIQGFSSDTYPGYLQFFYDTAGATLIEEIPAGSPSSFIGYRSDIPFQSIKARGMAWEYLPEGYYFSPSYKIYDLRYESAAAVPEPSTALLLVCGGTLLALRMRIRRQLND